MQYVLLMQIEQWNPVVHHILISWPWQPRLPWKLPLTWSTFRLRVEECLRTTIKNFASNNRASGRSRRRECSSILSTEQFFQNHSPPWGTTFRLHRGRFSHQLYLIHLLVSYSDLPISSVRVILRRLVKSPYFTMQSIKFSHSWFLKIHKTRHLGPRCRAAMFSFPFANFRPRSGVAGKAGRKAIRELQGDFQKTENHKSASIKLSESQTPQNASIRVAKRDVKPAVHSIWPVKGRILESSDFHAQLV